MSNMTSVAKQQKKERRNEQREGDRAHKAWKKQLKKTVSQEIPELKAFVQCLEQKGFPEVQYNRISMHVRKTGMTQICELGDCKKAYVTSDAKLVIQDGSGFMDAYDAADYGRLSDYELEYILERANANAG